MCDSTDRNRAHHEPEAARQSGECLCDCALVVTLTNHFARSTIKPETGTGTVLPFSPRPASQPE